MAPGTYLRLRQRLPKNSSLKLLNPFDGKKLTADEKIV